MIVEEPIRTPGWAPTFNDISAYFCYNVYDEPGASAGRIGVTYSWGGTTMNRHNLTMATDLYQLTMVYGYYKSGTAHRKAVFDLFFRRLPWGNGYAIAAGLEQAIEYLNELHFAKDDLDYLRSLGTVFRRLPRLLGETSIYRGCGCGGRGNPHLPQ